MSPATLRVLRTIVRLRERLEAEGARVILHSNDLPDGVVGRFHYPDDANDPTALQIDVGHPDGEYRATLLALAHEAGRYRSWRLGRSHDEDEAQLFGLEELRAVGFEPWPGEWDWWHDPDGLPVPDGWERVA